MSEFRKLLGVGFRNIRKRGYIARQNFMCCTSCALAELEDTEKYVFYNAQDNGAIRDAERRNQPPEVYLAWGGDGQEVRKTFLEAGLVATWSGSVTARIWVSMPPKNSGANQ